MKQYLLFITFLIFSTIVCAQHEQILKEATELSEKEDHLGTIEKLTILINDDEYRNKSKFDLHFWRACEKYEYYGADSAYLDFNESSFNGNLIAKEILRNARKFGIYQPNSFIEYTLKEKNLHEKNNFKPKYSKADTLQGKLTHIRSCFDVLHYDLTVKFNIKKKSIAGNNTITFKLIKPSTTIQIDLFKQYKIKSININNQIVNFKRKENAIFITFLQQ